MPYSPTDIGMLISLCCASIATLIYSTQKSKCVSIKCGCVECIRDVNQIQNDLELGELPLPPTTPPILPPIPLRNVQASLTPALTSLSPSVASLRSAFERPHSASSS